MIAINMGFLCGASGKEPACQYRRHKTRAVRSLGWEDPLQEGMTTHSSILFFFFLSLTFIYLFIFLILFYF